MGNDNTRDDWDSFDWNGWGVAPDSENAADGHTPAQPTPAEQADHYPDGFLRPPLADVEDDDSAPRDRAAAGRWVTHGGVLQWQSDDDESEEAPLREEALSPWASDEIELPLGAPATARVRAVRAWLARRRLRETELIGALLLERRRLAGPADEEDEEGESAARPAPPENPNDPLALALTEAQAAADEYEMLLGLLDDTRTHAGPQATLVEFYLAITERLATLAGKPAAPDNFGETVLFAPIEREPASGEPSPSDKSEWEGRAGAALATRKRVEQVTAAEPEDD